MTKNIMIVGVGGQGTLLTSRVLGKAALAKGYDVKISEVHGMAQRGGSVVTFVRFGDQVNEPVVEEGQADLIIAFERLEALRYAHFLKKDGVLVVNNCRIDPMTVTIGVGQYPENILEDLAKTHTVYSIDGAQPSSVQLSPPYMTTGKTIALTRRTFVGKVMSLYYFLNVLLDVC